MRSRNRQWWIGLAAGFLLGQLFYGGATLMLEHAVANGEEEQQRFAFSTVNDPIKCVCDDGHEWEDRGACGVTFVVFGQPEWGPYCPIHIGELLEDFFPKAWAVEDDDDD